MKQITLTDFPITEQSDCRLLISDWVTDWLTDWLTYLLTDSLTYLQTYRFLLINDLNFLCVDCWQLRIQLFFYELTKSQKFDIAIMVLIMLNMITMAIEYEDQPEAYSEALEWINIVFIILFTSECIMKLLGLRLYYFKEPWNVFDFFIVITSVVSK